MKLHYVEVENWDKLGHHDIIYFNLPNKRFEYEVMKLKSVFCDNNTFFNNSAIFDYLNLDAEDFVENIVGYKCPQGVWPVVKSIDDLKKVIKALDDECVKKFGKLDTPKFKVGDKVRILPRKGNSKDYLGPYVDDMLLYVGKITTIRKINSDSSIYLDNNTWLWDPKALELVSEKEESETISSPSTSIKIDKSETQFEAELNLFPTKKHYQLNFNY